MKKFPNGVKDFFKTTYSIVDVGAVGEYTVEAVDGDTIEAVDEDTVEAVDKDTVGVVDGDTVDSAVLSITLKLKVRFEDQRFD